MNEYKEESTVSKPKKPSPTLNRKRFHESLECNHTHFSRKKRKVNYNYVLNKGNKYRKAVTQTKKTKLKNKKPTKKIESKKNRNSSSISAKG